MEHADAATEAGGGDKCENQPREARGRGLSQAPCCPVWRHVDQRVTSPRSAGGDDWVEGRESFAGVGRKIPRLPVRIPIRDPNVSLLSGVPCHGSLMAALVEAMAGDHRFIR